MKCIDAGKRKLNTLFNKIKNVVRKYWMMRPNFFKFPQTWLAISVFGISFLFYLHLKVSGNSWCFTEFLLIVLIIPALVYAFGSYYYTCAVITVRPECFQDEAQELEGKALKDKELYVHSDGKVYSIRKEFPQLKIYFSRKGKHSVYLYDENGMVGDGPQKANTYEHHIDYVEFKKRITKANQRMPEKKANNQMPRQ